MIRTMELDTSEDYRAGDLILGLDPGPYFLTEHLDIAFGLAFVVGAANLIGVVLLLPVISKISLITRVQGHVLGPILLVFVVLGAYSIGNNPIDLLFVFIFGPLGYFMREFGYSRPALMLGFVLGPLVETYLHISLTAYGPWFFTRPISLLLVVLIILGVAVPLIREFRREKAHGQG